MKKNLILLFFSVIIPFVFLYLILLFYIFVNIDKDNSYKFESFESLNFHKKYSQKMHHIRWMGMKKEKLTDYMYSTISDYKINQSNVLFHGDSWSELLTDPDFYYDESKNFIKNFSKKNNLGFINAGITSYSPSLMTLQLEILEKDFNIKPSIIIAYIDQSDIGDENCRYKNKKIFKNNKLFAVKTESYTGGPFDYTKIYKESEIYLKNDSKIKKTFKLLNFKIKYKFLKTKNKNLEKFKKFIENDFKKIKNKKCHWVDIENYLYSSSEKDINYFKKNMIEYINYIEENPNIKNLIIVTFPHKKHISDLADPEDKIYNHNIANIIDELIGENQKTEHLNFTKLIKDKIITIKKNDYLEDYRSHITPDYYKKIFIKEIAKHIASKN